MNNFEKIPSFENLRKESASDEKALEEKDMEEECNNTFVEERSLQEGRVYEKKALDLPFFHSTHFSNFLKILDKGAISSGYGLIKEGLNPGNDFEAKTGGMSGALERLKGNDREILYNGIFFSIGGIPEEGSDLYYSDACPVSFLLDRKGLRHYAFGTTHEGAGDAIVSNKNPERPTKINLSHLSAVFLPEDIYFNSEGKIIEPPSERFSYISFAEDFYNKFEEIEKDIIAYRDLVKKIEDVGLKSEVEEEIKNIYLSALNDARQELKTAPENLKGMVSQEIKSLEAYEQQVEWGGAKGLLALDDHSVNLIRGAMSRNRYELSDEGISAGLGIGKSVEDKKIEEYVKSQDKIIVVKDLVLDLFRSLPYIGSGFSEEDQERNRFYYEENKEKINALLEDINKRLNLRGSSSINPLDFETIKGRFFYSMRSGLYDFIKKQNDWEQYEKKGEDNKYQTSKDFIINLISQQGGVIKETDEGLLIENYEQEHLPPKIVFFDGDFVDAINKYTLENYRIKLPSHKLPYREIPTLYNKTRIDAAKAVNNKLEELTKRKRANYHSVGDIHTTFGKTKVFSNQRINKKNR